MGSNKALVRVKIYREFTYPKSMLHPVLFIQDAIGKAQNDMQIIINEILNNDHNEIGLNLFQFETTEEVGYRFRKPLLEGRVGESVNLARATKALTNQKMEDKYGPLNHEQNPAIYVHEDAVMTPRGDILRPEAWYFKADIEHEYYETYNTISQFLAALT